MDKEALEKKAELPKSPVQVIDVETALQHQIYLIAQQDMLRAGYRKLPKDKPLLFEEHEIKHIEIALKDHYGNQWCAVCDSIAKKLGFSPKGSRY